MGNIIESKYLFKRGDNALYGIIYPFLLSIIKCRGPPFIQDFYFEWLEVIFYG